MKNLRSGNFLILLALLLISCKKDVYKSYKLDFVLQEKDYTRVIPENSTYIYKTGVDAYGHYLSGLLIIKAFTSDDYRLVFTTEMGVKLFDFEFKEDKFLVHYCINKLDKKPVLKLLEKDFNLILGRHLVNNKFKVIKDSLSESPVYFIKKEREAIFYEQIAKGRFFSKVSVFSLKGKEKVAISFEKAVDVVPSRIILEHRNLDLNMKLDLIKR